MSALVTTHLASDDVMNQVLSLTRLTGWRRFLKGNADITGIQAALTQSGAPVVFDESGWMFNPLWAWLEDTAPELIAAGRAHPIAASLLQARAALEAIVVTPAESPTWLQKMAAQDQPGSEFLGYCVSYYDPVEGDEHREPVDVPAHCVVPAYLDDVLRQAGTAHTAVILVG